jgi:Protein of unknown function (DUF1364)
MTYRNRRLLDLCHQINECQLRIPGVCVGYSQEGCEPAHGPKSVFRGGMGLKSDDLPCAACRPCHAELDQGQTLTAAERHEYWTHGAIRTTILLLERGWLTIPGGAP